MARPTALRDALRVKPGTRVRLEKLDPGATFGHDKASAVAATASQMERLRDLQDRMWAEAQALRAGRPPGHRRRRQGRHDRQGHGGVQPAGLSGHLVQGADRRRSSPTTTCGGSTSATPGKGEIGIFNRSHYEDVLVVRVHDLVAASASGRSATTRSTTSSGRWPRAARRSSSSSCRSIATSSASGSRSATTTRRSAGSSASATSRSASSGTTTRPPSTRRLAKTSTAWAPWYVIPANRNWFRNLAVVDDPGRHDGRPEAGATRRRRTCRRTSSSSRTGPRESRRTRRAATRRSHRRGRPSRPVPGPMRARSQARALPMRARARVASTAAARSVRGATSVHASA